MLSEDIAFFAFPVCVAAAYVLAGHSPRLNYWAVRLLVAGALCAMCVLIASSLLRVPLQDLHRAAGHLMLPIVVSAAGFWLGARTIDDFRRPVRFMFRLFFLMVLCFCCFSNTRTGYFGPSHVDPERFPDTILRFQVLHQVVMPTAILLMLMYWLCRLIFFADKPPVQTTTRTDV